MCEEQLYPRSRQRIREFIRSRCFVLVCYTREEGVIHTPQDKPVHQHQRRSHGKTVDNQQSHPDLIPNPRPKQPSPQILSPAQIPPPTPPVRVLIQRSQTRRNILILVFTLRRTAIPRAVRIRARSARVIYERDCAMEFVGGVAGVPGSQ